MLKVSNGIRRKPLKRMVLIDYFEYIACEMLVSDVTSQIYS